MKNLTLYRIKKGSNASLDYYVASSYRMVTQATIAIPPVYSFSGVFVSDVSLTWFADAVLPIIEMHNGERIIDTWAKPMLEEPDFVTVSLCYDNTLLVPDLLHNTISWKDDKQRQREVVSAIANAISRCESKHIHVPATI